MSVWAVAMDRNKFKKKRKKQFPLEFATVNSFGPHRIQLNPHLLYGPSVN